MNAVEKLAVRYKELIGSPPEGIWFAPGRVNLIGEHTDYNDGFVLPFALEQRALVAAGLREDARVVMHALDLGETTELSLPELRPGIGGWQAYLSGVLWALREAGNQVGGITMVLTSDVPFGAGLSSSAAIECSGMAAACDLFGLDIAPMDRAKLAQRAENVYVGAPTGLLDQAASTLCRADTGLFLDCRTLETAEVPLPLHEQGVEILVLDTRTPHSHVDGEYGERRATCEQAARLLGVSALRDVTDLEAALAELPDERMRKRVRHVVPLLDASHASMRDDYEITVPTVDLAVETARHHGALGARMTGGGFGGCIIAWCSLGQAVGIADAIQNAFREAEFREPAWFTAKPSEGAGRLA